MVTVGIKTTSGVAFVTNVDLVIGSTTVVHANINAATNTGVTTNVVIQTATGITASIANGSTVVTIYITSW